MIIDDLPGTYGETIARMYRHGWLEGSIFTVGKMPRLGSTRINVSTAYHEEYEINYITRRANLDWEKEKYGRLSFDILRLRQWLSLEKTSSLIFYKQRIAVREAKKWKSLLKNHGDKKRKR